MKILKKTAEKVAFVAEVDESLANALRRSSLEIPVLAIEEVEFHKNDSVLYDEVLALRLGLIPLKTPKTMVLPEKCSCNGKGCAKCSVQLKLKVSGAGTVYSKDLKSNKIEVVYSDMPLTELSEGQELELVATAKLGKGIQHTKYSPGLVYYRNAPELETEKDAKIEDLEKCAEACPQKILRVNKDKLEFTERYKCDLCESCAEACKKKIKIFPGKEIVFFIESWGQMEAQEILENSVKVLKENLKLFK